MKIYNLSGQVNSPCFILKHAGVTVMLDCHLDTSCLHRFLPVSTIEDFSMKHKTSGESSKGIDEVEFIDAAPEFIVPETEHVDMATVDVILLTTHQSILALPFITEYTSFHGAVYATEPVLNFGKLLMEELVANVSRVRKDKASSSAPPSKLKLNSSAEARRWRCCYNQYDVTACVSKVTLVSFNQAIDIPGGLKVKACSSGYSIGSCSWLIYSDHHKISYVGAASSLSTHTMPMGKSDLKNCDVMLMSCLTQNPLNNPDNYMREFCLNTSMTLKRKGRVLVPCSMVGVVFDLIDCLFSHLDSSSLLSTPVYIISPVAKNTLAFSNIYAEWLSSHKQCKVYQPESPFVHHELIKSGRLEVFSSLSEDFSKAVKHPCVVFCSDQLLRYGDVVELMLEWKDNCNNSVIFTEPSLNCLEVLGPYLPMKMKVFHCPIDTHLSTCQANKLIKDLQPHHLIVPQQYVCPFTPEVSIDADLNPLPLGQGGMQRVSLKRRFQKVTIASDLADSLDVRTLKKQYGVSVVNGFFSGKDYKYFLKPFNKSKPVAKDAQESTHIPDLRPRLTFNPPNTTKLLQCLAEQGVEAEVEKEEEDGRVVLSMRKENAQVEINSNSTTISFNNTSTNNNNKDGRRMYKIIKNAVFASIAD